jgi:quercetin dioxygenase-like cupin family protein
VNVDSAITYLDRRPFPSLEILFKYKLLNTPDKTILGAKVIFPPNASTPPHTHAGAFVAVHVLSGSVLNKMNDAPMTIKKTGDSFYEAPGCRHRISDNASATEEASIFVTFVLETDIIDAIIEKDGIAGLVVIDEEYKGIVMAQMMKMQAEAGKI